MQTSTHRDAKLVRELRVLRLSWVESPDRRFELNKRTGTYTELTMK